MSQGFVIMATGIEQYKTCADTLAQSIHRVMPDAKVSLITDQYFTNSELYDKIIPLPYKDVDSSEWKLANDWQVYEASPYDRTIKLEADMYLPRTIDHWWDILKDRDLNICSTIRDFKNNISDVKAYRKTFVDSKLPDTYNAITYFRKSELAARFFILVRDIFENWIEYSTLLRFSSESRATTDVVYAIASRIIGEEQCTLPTFTDFSMIHMKQRIIDTLSVNWTDELVIEVHNYCVRFNTHPQLYPIHYQIKEFANQITQELTND